MARLYYNIFNDKHYVKPYRLILENISIYKFMPDTEQNSVLETQLKVDMVYEL